MRKLVTLCLIGTLGFLSPATAGWRLQSSVDPITDEGMRSVTAAEENGQGWFAITCWLRGKSNKMNAEVDIGEYFVGTSYFVEVTTRVDKAEPVTQKWVSFEKKQQALSDDPPHELVESMKKGNQLVVRLTDDQYNTYTRFFDLAGFTAAMQKLNCR